MIIGLNGFKGSGKDTVGAYLVEKHGFERLSFAAKLKESAAALFGIDPSLWEVLKNDISAVIEIEVNKGVTQTEDVIAVVTVREFLQRYGTESHRDIFGQDFWVDYALKGVDPNKNYVFTDARFENELEKIRSLNGYNVQIIRGDVDSSDNHASEVAPPERLIDAIVYNDGTFDELYKQIDQVLDDIKYDAYIDWYMEDNIESENIYESERI